MMEWVGIMDIFFVFEGLNNSEIRKFYFESAFDCLRWLLALSEMDSIKHGWHLTDTAGGSSMKN